MNLKKITLFIFLPFLVYGEPIKNKIYIYNGPGASRYSVHHLHKTFSNLKKYKIETTSYNKIIDNSFDRDAVAIVIPGGADLKYAKYLNGTGNKNIKDFVKKGGVYIGVCAGSYYGSSYTEFDKQGPSEVIGKRELGFFAGKTIGPVFAKYYYNSLKGMRATKIKTSIGDKKELIVFLNGGGYFVDAQKYKDTKVIAKYSKNDKAAIILVNYGKGKVLLSAPHFEYDPFLIRGKTPNEKKEIEYLKASDNFRKKYALDVLKLVLWYSIVNISNFLSEMIEPFDNN